MFVETRGTQFHLGGERLPLIGVNCYFLGYCSRSAREPVLARIQELGCNVVRAWAFLDTPALTGQVTFQYQDGTRVLFNDGRSGLELLDGLIADAEQHGIHLILPLVNHWEDFGGAPMYLRWLGINGAADEFYRQRAPRDLYRKWVEHLLNRVNIHTGRKYKDEPSILAWELANEPRCEKAGRDVLLDWVREMSSFVKALDSNHLLAVGDEGHFKKNGVDTKAFLALPHIGFGTCHFYPGSFNITTDDAPKWIQKRIEAGRAVDKPVILEEFGVLIDGIHVRSAGERDRWYARWLRTVRLGGGAGDLLWMIGSHDPDVAGFHDKYTVYSPAEVPSLPAHAAEMQTPVDAPQSIEPLDDNALVFVDLLDGGAAVSPEGTLLTFLRDGKQIIVDNDPHSSGFLVPAAVRGSWTVQIAAPGYAVASTDFFQLMPGDLRVVTQQLAHDGRVSASS